MRQKTEIINQVKPYCLLVPASWFLAADHCLLISAFWLLVTPERSEGSPTQMGKLRGAP